MRVVAVVRRRVRSTRSTRDRSLHATQAVVPESASVMVGQYGPAAPHARRAIFACGMRLEVAVPVPAVAAELATTAIATERAAAATVGFTAPILLDERRTCTHLSTRSHEISTNTHYLVRCGDAGRGRCDCR